MTVGTDVVRDDMPYESSVNDSRGARRICVMHSIFIIGKVGGWSVDFDGNAIWQSAEAETKVEEQTADAAKEVS